MFLFLIVFLVYLIYLLYFLLRKLVRNFRMYNLENNPVNLNVKIILPDKLENNFDNNVGPDLKIE